MKNGKGFDGCRRSGSADQRINDMPKVNDVVQVIAKEAEDILRGIQRKHLA